VFVKQEEKERYTAANVVKSSVGGFFLLLCVSFFGGVVAYEHVQKIVHEFFGVAAQILYNFKFFEQFLVPSSP